MGKRFGVRFLLCRINRAGTAITSGNPVRGEEGRTHPMVALKAKNSVNFAKHS